MVKGASLNACVLLCRAFPGCRALRLEEDQWPDGQHDRLPAHSATLDHQGRFCQSARRLSVKRNGLLQSKTSTSVCSSLAISLCSPLWFVAGRLACTVTASWQATPCGTWWWCTCWRGSTSPLCPTCWSSTTTWLTRHSRFSTCCWPSAPWLLLTGKTGNFLRNLLKMESTFQKGILCEVQTTQYRPNNSPIGQTWDLCF